MGFCGTIAVGPRCALPSAPTGVDGWPRGGGSRSLTVGENPYGGYGDQAA